MALRDRSEAPISSSGRQAHAHSAASHHRAAYARVEAGASLSAATAAASSPRGRRNRRQQQPRPQCQYIDGCQCDACTGQLPSPRSQADAAIATAAKKRVKDYMLESPTTSPRLPTITSPRGQHSPRAPTQSPGGQQSPRARHPRARKKQLTLELPDEIEDADESGEPALPKQRSGPPSASKLERKMEEQYKKSHSAYSPRTMAIYSDRKHAMANGARKTLRGFHAMFGRCV